ncbi:MAG: YifB family Mg chelatase-like AAA ATPase [Lachnospiraceae bacterium]|nr:YifB family Mg chelatase-like AAA ATPase [Lachnospiraceae bacterium]
MYSTVYSGGINGIGCYMAKVEIDLSRALPAWDMVGKLSHEVIEAKERVKVALKNAGIVIPPLHITINISPANIRKSGTGYDLPIALGIVTALGFIPEDILEGILVIGELGLDGSVAPVKGILPIVSAAAAHGFKTCIVPNENAAEASYASGINVIGVSCFEEAMHTITDLSDASYVTPRNIAQMIATQDFEEDFSDVSGQAVCKRAALIAAAGFHHMFISGPPGSGKTMIAKRLRTIMPPLTVDECIEVSGIYSIAGKLTCDDPIITRRPYQSPHHAATLSSLTGGGYDLHPGILSLCHRGILFLDELPEFSRECIEALREPLENKQIQMSRVSGSVSYPADFLLVAAANPCPCGFYPDRNRCNCTEHEIRRYNSRISGPIRDRIDIIVSSEKMDISGLTGSSDPNGSSEHMRGLVLKARSIQEERFKNTPYRYNSHIRAADIGHFCPLDEESMHYAEEVYRSMNLSARSYHKLLRVARTIADLEESEHIRISDLAEAVCYRT